MWFYVDRRRGRVSPVFPMFILYSVFVYLPSLLNPTLSSFNRRQPFLSSWKVFSLCLRLALIELKWIDFFCLPPVPEKILVDYLYSFRNPNQQLYVILVLPDFKVLFLSVFHKLLCRINKPVLFPCISDVYGLKGAHQLKPEISSFIIILKDLYCTNFSF